MNTVSYPINNALHVRLVGCVSVQQLTPLIRWNANTCLLRHVNNLCIVLPAQCFISSVLFFKLHQRTLVVSLGHLVHGYVQIRCFIVNRQGGKCQYMGAYVRYNDILLRRRVPGQSNNLFLCLRMSSDVNLEM